METTPAQAAEGMAIVRVLSAVLDRLVSANSSLARADPGQVTKFHALKAPAIGILQYLERIHKYASCSSECFILALIYVDRLIQRNNFLLTELNVHRVVITAILLAAKFFDDAYYNNAYYAKVGGVLVSEMNNLEVEFLFRINFSLHVTPDLFQKYHAELISHAVGATGESKTESIQCALSVTAGQTQPQFSVAPVMMPSNNGIVLFQGNIPQNNEYNSLMPAEHESRNGFQTTHRHRMHPQQITPSPTPPASYPIISQQFQSVSSGCEDMMMSNTGNASDNNLLLLAEQETVNAAAAVASKISVQGTHQGNYVDLTQQNSFPLHGSGSADSYIFVEDSQYQQPQQMSESYQFKPSSDPFVYQNGHFGVHQAACRPDLDHRASSAPVGSISHGPSITPNFVGGQVLTGVSGGY